MIKRLFAFFICVVTVFGVCVTPHAAQQNETPQSEFLTNMDEFFGKLTSVASRWFNSAVKKDESIIPQAQKQQPSWVEFDTSTIDFEAEQTIHSQSWLANEITYISDKAYSDPFNDVCLDLLLFGNGRQYKIPGFWDGDNIWKVRFACPSEGVWYFKTVCSDKSNNALNGKTGKIICSAYTGEHDVYKKGFVTTSFGKKYFTYDNGEPFFYLGDTHWSLGDETQDMVSVICKKRTEQGFTVFQSEPIGAAFDFTNGITQEDIPALADYDKKFKIIAEHGLTHANAQFFFTSYMETLITLNGGYDNDGMLTQNVKSYLEKISRYWVARYSAYPVIWTLGQECDNDFYNNKNASGSWNYKNNPYKLVAEYIAKYDPYTHPLSAHQENTGETSPYGNGKNAADKQKVYNKRAESSCFRDVKAHSFYAVQWSPSKIKQSDFKAEKDCWFNSQGKPAINYEGQYCYLWTKNFGARMQGYVAYLNGMYGYGWGAHDTWSYLNTYDEDKTSTDGVDIITSQEKTAATWQDALEYESSYQMGYMRSFFESIQWYNLIPRFNNKAYFVPRRNVYYTYSSNSDNSEIVIYLYSFSDESVAQKANTKRSGGVNAGTVGSLIPNAAYTYKWFDPISGEYSQESEFCADRFGTYFLPQKPTATDMVLLIKLKDNN